MGIDLDYVLTIYLNISMQISLLSNVYQNDILFYYFTYRYGWNI